MKLKIFESNSNEQHLFVFNIVDIFTEEELQMLKAKPEQLSSLYKEAVDRRLRIKEVEVNYK